MQAFIPMVSEHTSYDCFPRRIDAWMLIIKISYNEGLDVAYQAQPQNLPQSGECNKLT